MMEMTWKEKIVYYVGPALVGVLFNWLTGHIETWISVAVSIVVSLMFSHLIVTKLWSRVDRLGL